MDPDCSSHWSSLGSYRLNLYSWCSNCMVHDISNQEYSQSYSVKSLSDNIHGAAILYNISMHKFSNGFHMKYEIYITFGWLKTIRWIFTYNLNDFLHFSHKVAFHSAIFSYTFQHFLRFSYNFRIVFPKNYPVVILIWYNFVIQFHNKLLSICNTRPCFCVCPLIEFQLLYVYEVKLIIKIMCRL